MYSYSLHSLYYSFSRLAFAGRNHGLSLILFPQIPNISSLIPNRYSKIFADLWMIYALLWQIHYGQAMLFTGMLVTPGSYELPDVVDKALVPCLDSCDEN